MPSPQSSQMFRSSVACEPCNKISEEPLQTRALKSCLQLQLRLVQSWRLTGKQMFFPASCVCLLTTCGGKCRGVFLGRRIMQARSRHLTWAFTRARNGRFLLLCCVSSWLGARVSLQCHVFTTCAEKHSKLLRGSRDYAFCFFVFLFSDTGDVSTVTAFLCRFFFFRKVSVISKVQEGCI